MLKRLLQGEEANQNLFNELLNGLSALEKSQNNEEIRNIEMLIVLRLLHNLGYIGTSDHVDNLIDSPFEQNIIFEVSQKRNKILSEINKALRESHL